jgi:hypothetical protein
VTVTLDDDAVAGTPSSACPTRKASAAAAPHMAITDIMAGSLR